MTYVVEATAVAILMVLLVLARRMRGRAGEMDARLHASIGPGSRVMTTSGLYATVVAVNSDDTVMLSVAAGVEVRWAFAALRDAATLPPQYRRPIDSATGPGAATGGKSVLAPAEQAAD